MTARRATAVLAAVVALQLVAETALTPWWPELMRRLFGRDDLAATGTFLAVCRAAGLLALPLWGLAALRWPVRSLLATGLGLCAVLDLALALAPTWASFTVLSAAVVASGSVLVLAFPALVEVTERPGRAPRRRGVVAYWAVVHTSLVLATLVGAAVVALDQPRWGLAAFAVVDAGLAVAVLALLPRGGRRSRRRRDPAAAGPARPRRTTALRPWVVLVPAVVGVDAALAVTRPFFVEMLLRGGTDAAVAAWLFLAPAAASVAVLPATGAVLDRLGRGAAPAAAALGGTGLLLQGVAAAQEDLVGVLVGRLLLGAGAGVLLVVLDLVVLDRIGTDAAAVSAVETGRSGALLAAPVLATLAAGAWIGAPLLLGAALLLAAGLLLTRASSTLPGPLPDPFPTTTPEATHDLDPAR